MRMTYAHNLDAPKKATNLSINSDLLTQAKKLGINISSFLETSLAQEVQRLKTQAWLKENESAIRAYNEDVESHGAFGDSLRAF